MGRERGGRRHKVDGRALLKEKKSRSHQRRVSAFREPTRERERDERRLLEDPRTE